MRTTLTIENDVAVQLEWPRRQLDASLKDIINEALRRGLRDMAAPAKSRKPFQFQPIDVGKMLIPNIDNVAEVLAILEDTPCEPR
jgi:hypothetical protein